MGKGKKKSGSSKKGSRASGSQTGHGAKRAVLEEVEMKGGKVDLSYEAEEDKEEEEARGVLLDLHEWLHRLDLADDLVSTSEKKELVAKVRGTIEEHEMTHVYKQLTGRSALKLDKKLLKTMEDANAKKMLELKEREEDALKNAGESEVRQVLEERALYLAKVGDPKDAKKAFEAVLEKTVSAGAKIELYFAMIRMAIFQRDFAFLKESIATCADLVENAADWERRNRFKVYTAVYHMLIRDFSPAAELLLDSIATFTCLTVTSYNNFVLYAAVTAIVATDRLTIGEQVVRSPEVLAVIDQIPHLRALVENLYKCKYGAFFQALADIEPTLKRDPFLSTHVGFLLREIRIVAYKQYLQSYRSITLQSMSASFGVSVPFIDTELSRFISAGRLHAKIDKVHGVVETTRLAGKNSQYQETLKLGDALLNRLQKLSKVLEAK